MSPNIKKIKNLKTYLSAQLHNIKNMIVMCIMLVVLVIFFLFLFNKMYHSNSSLPLSIDIKKEQKKMFSGIENLKVDTHQHNYKKSIKNKLVLMHPVGRGI
jgi:uncharacterized ion transporter superfamily protein YfcC